MARRVHKAVQGRKNPWPDWDLEAVPHGPNKGKPGVKMLCDYWNNLN